MAELTSVNFRVPETLLVEFEDMARVLGMSKGDLHRDIWIAGLQTYCERMNKVFVNKGQRLKYYPLDNEEET